MAPKVASSSKCVTHCFFAVLHFVKQRCTLTAVNHLSKILVLSVVSSGCVGPDLGDMPFKCNDGQPNCPDGYHCEGAKPDWVCVRDGYIRADASLPPGDLTIIPDFNADFTTPADSSVDSGWQPLDQGIPIDQGGAVDSAPLPMDAFIAADLPHLGCQDNVECKSQTPDSPCCCKVTILWACLPFCLDPFCLGLP